jgi:poly(3-hydroxybutyrate) depolymerase
MNRWIASSAVFTLVASSSCWESLAPSAPAASTPQVSPLAAAIPLAEGRSKIEVNFNGTKLDVFTYKPQNWKGERMLFVIHGMDRNAEEYRDHSIGMGDRFDALVVAPLFDEKRFPSRKFHLGGIRNEDCSHAKPEEWTYAFIPRIATAIRQRESKPDLKIWIIGHSAGGQFTMRMSAFQAAGVERFVAANPGTDLFPRRDWKFGFGFGALPESLSNDAQLQNYLAAPLTLYLGTADNFNEGDLDMSPEAMLQGDGRLQRGRAAFAAGKKLAAEHRWKFAWRLVEAEGIDHDHQKMFANEQCESALFGP